MQLIADNINIMHPAVARAVRSNDPGPITALAKRCTDLGADFIDVNPGPGTRKGGQHMDFCLRAVQAGTHLPLCLDSNDPHVLRHGLSLCSGQVVLNGFSLEPAKVETILPLALEFQVPIVGFLLTPEGNVPTSLDQRLELAAELISLCTGSGMDLEQLIIDPVLAPLTWDDGSAQAGNVLACIRHLPELCGKKVNTIVGLSNLTSGVSDPAAPYLEAFYLTRLAEAGLTYALVNMDHTLDVAGAKFCATLDGGGVFSWAEFDPLLPPPGTRGRREVSG